MKYPTKTFSCSGCGAAGAAGFTDQVDVIVGTLSKGFGAHGGFVACDAALKRLLLSAARTQMFSTALPLPMVAAAHAALDVAQQVRLADQKSAGTELLRWARVKQHCQDHIAGKGSCLMTAEPRHLLLQAVGMPAC